MLSGQMRTHVSTEKGPCRDLIYKPPVQSECIIFITILFHGFRVSSDKRYIKWLEIAIFKSVFASKIKHINFEGMLNLTCTWHRINQKTLYNNIPWLLVTLTMSHILYICCYIASLGFFNAGIIHSWPATAIPSIRWKWTLKVIATTIVMKLCTYVG